MSRKYSLVTTKWFAGVDHAAHAKKNLPKFYKSQTTLIYEYGFSLLTLLLLGSVKDVNYWED